MRVQEEVPFGERRPRPGHAATHVVGIVQRGGQLEFDLRLRRRQRDRAGFIDVADGDGDGDGVVCAGRVRGGYGHGVAGLALEVQGGSSPQPARSGDNVEGVPAGDVQGVGQGIVLGVGGRDGCADVRTRGRVLGHVARRGRALEEDRRVIRRHRRCLHPIGRDRLCALARPFSIGVGGGGPQVVGPTSAATGV